MLSKVNVVNDEGPLREMVLLHMFVANCFVIFLAEMREVSRFASGAVSALAALWVNDLFDLLIALILLPKKKKNQ